MLSSEIEYFSDFGSVTTHQPRLTKYVSGPSFDCNISFKGIQFVSYHTPAHSLCRNIRTAVTNESESPVPGKHESKPPSHTWKQKDELAKHVLMMDHGRSSRAFARGKTHVNSTSDNVSYVRLKPSESRGIQHPADGSVSSSSSSCEGASWPELACEDGPHAFTGAGGACGVGLRAQPDLPRVVYFLQRLFSSASSEAINP